ncbi:MAG TPA: GMC family oxidoreductase [Candidatus Limnocylindria bacterium]|nr:GMC family oxidoreductase [Candidatus Limnocylindria bacterium]
MAAEHVDAVVVGSGAAGAIMAAKLSAAGKKVVILEGGTTVQPREMVSADIYGRRLHWGGPAPAVRLATPAIHTNFSTGWQTGGTATHHYAAWFRLHEEDFRMRSTFGRGNDWPISYDELRPYYDRIQTEVGISGDATAEVWRPAGEPYPMPGLPTFAQGAVIKRGFEKLGMRTAPLPVAINTREYHGRPACLYDGWCDAGCPIGALANPQTVYLKAALAQGAELRTHATVTRVLTTANGKRATGVEYVDADGTRRMQPADVVVLAAFAIQNPRILLNSANAAHPNGLANVSGMVGKNLLVHPTTNVYGMFAEETQPAMGVAIGQLVSQDGYAKDPQKGFLASYQWLIASAWKPNGLLGLAASRQELYGAALDDFMHRAAKHIGTLQMVGETFPVAENRVELASDKDAYGFPLARVVFSWSDNERALYEHASGEGLSVLRAAGATETWRGPLVNQHLMGGTIMGNDPRTSVADSFGVTHEVPNLVIAGPGLYPTSAALNPTFTLHALALRGVERILRAWPG